jgi:CBS domain-containing protein
MFKCSDLMKINLQWVPGSANVRDAARQMRDNALGFLLVSDGKPGHVAGVLTDRDLATRVCAEDKLSRDVKVIDVASVGLVTCGEDDLLEDAEAKMREDQKSRLVVLNAQGQAVGILSLTDVILHERPRRALKTARAVLAREGEGPHTPIEQIKLTPSTPEDEEAVSHQQSVMTGRTVDSNTKMFP